MLLVWHGSVLEAILPQLELVLAVSVLAVFAHGFLVRHNIRLDVAPFALLGVSLAIFLGFRNSASYDRF
jgi:ion channel-forming bestrophin family protein